MITPHFITYLTLLNLRLQTLTFHQPLEIQEEVFSRDNEEGWKFYSWMNSADLNI